MKEVKSSTIEKEKTVNRCSYLDEFNRNIPRMEFINKQLCLNFPNRYEKDGKHYCIFHYPDKDKINDFELALEQKKIQGHYFFSGTWFPKSVDFSWQTFESLADFSHCVFVDDVEFNNSIFSIGVDFRCAKFKRKANFSYAVFPNLQDTTEMETSFYSSEFENEANFFFTKFYNRIDFSQSKFLGSASFFETLFNANASFKKTHLTSAYFSETIFEKNVDFYESTIITASFNKSIFKKVADFRESNVTAAINFEGSSFEGFAKFSGKDNKHNSWSSDALNFKSVDVEKPEKISFRSLKLKPDFFINTDTRKFEFTNIKWERKFFGGDWSRFKDFKFWKEEAKQRKSQYELLSIAYRRLATNAEENNRYQEASKFRFTSNEVDRIGSHWYGRITPLSWLYKWSSRFGENWWWALIVLILILTAFVFYYHFAYFQICPKGSENCVTRTMNWFEAIHQSLMTAALQNVEYRKTILPQQDLVILLQKILSPIQAALLALAIRRKFMR